MFRVALIFLLLTRVNTEVKSVQKSVYVSRKSRSNSAPIERGYVFSQVNNNPGSLATFGSDVSDNSFSHGFNSYYPTRSFKHSTSSPVSYNAMDEAPPMVMPYTEPLKSSYYADYAKSKADSKYHSYHLPSIMKSEAMYDRLKSLMHYKHPDGEMTNTMYDTFYDYHVDEDDIRTSSRSPYDNWPYFYHSPFEYEAMNTGLDIEKAKEKRYISDTNQIIPVHEEVDDIPHYFQSPIMTTSRYDRDVTTDNPVFGDQAFFSFVLNDYFDKSVDEDPLVFKGLWGNEFDHGSSSTDEDDYLKRDRRLGNHRDYDNDYSDITNKNFKHDSDSSKYTAGESSTEKAYDKKHEFDKHEKGDEHKNNKISTYENSGNNYRGFKDFVDKFANKFGGQEHMKDSKYVLKQNQDKGEKRKGFRRVYHKDEYQEDKEFFDNTNSSAKAEEKGGSAIHQGGSEAILKSHASAAIGNQANAFNNAGGASNKKFETNYRGHDHSKGADSEYNIYRDVAKKAALSNSADYVDRYRM